MKDPNIRDILRRTALLSYYNDPHSKVVEEMKLPVAKARIDMAVINGHFHGYEIKSAVDTLNRLPGQIVAYSKIFDFVTVVTENNHYGKVHSALPEWVGICVCSNTGRSEKLTCIREAKINTRKSGFHLAKLLWHNELVEVLTEQEIPFKKKDRSWILCQTLDANLPVTIISDIVREKLKARTTWQLKEDCEVE
ncbi:MAG TPA: sce7726 family protein [Chitinophagales bacterium]|nr:sce7726 family protein [Chitinophagales bacterium]